MLQILEPTASTPHEQVTSTGLADVHTLAPPEGARACLITVSTNGCFLTADGTDPSSTNGLAVPKDGLPYLLPVPKTLKVASQIAGNSVVNVLWVR